MSMTSAGREPVVPEPAKALPPARDATLPGGMLLPDRLQGADARQRRAAARVADAVIFVGGPWHGQTRPRPDPLPPAIDATGCTYIPWAAHPAAAGVSGGVLELTATYVVAALEARELQKRVEDYLLHCCRDDNGR
jgi:hypothetical protein